MTWIGDDAVARLRTIAEEPDFGGTRYRLLREIARGGMGVVYEAEDLELQRRVAIKVLAPELGSRDAAERMLAEARVIAQLEHPGIVPLHDAGVLSDGRVFYVMKMIRGRTGQAGFLSSTFFACVRPSRSHIRAASSIAISSRKTSWLASSAKCW